MKVACVIDSLGSGGAQRQLCTLAVTLKKRGMDVSMLTYHPHDFFLPMLREAGIECNCLRSRSIAGRILAIRRALRHGDQDVVLAFWEATSLYAELAAIPRRSWGLVVSERSASHGSDCGRRGWMRKLHRVADYVTANSHTGRMFIERASPSLKGRVATIYNATDLQVFCPASAPRTVERGSLRIVVAASHQALKNPLGLIEALAIARSRLPSLNVCVDWYGRLPVATDTAADRGAYDTACRVIRQRRLEDCFRLRPPVASIADVYRGADAVAMPSFFEGLSNVVCEAMACGRPILMSNVCDADNLVKNGHNGFLFDPFSSDDIARAIVEFASLDVAEREGMGRRSREMAERMFDPAVVADRYAEILSAAAARKQRSFAHWVPEIPGSAYRFLGDANGRRHRIPAVFERSHT